MKVNYVLATALLFAASFAAVVAAETAVAAVAVQGGTRDSPGQRMPDGTVYAGVSPETGKAMFTTAADAPATCTFNQAQENAVKLDARGRRDWRVPTKDELNVLYQNRAAIGGFEESGSELLGWYWSSSPYSHRSAWAQRFSDGHQDYYDGKLNISSMRCVR